MPGAPGKNGRNGANGAPGQRGREGPVGEQGDQVPFLSDFLRCTATRVDSCITVVSDCLIISLLPLWEGYRESRRCSRDTYPEAYITKYTSIYV